MRRFLFKHLTYAFILGIGFGLIAGLGFRLAQKHRMYTEKNGDRKMKVIVVGETPESVISNEKGSFGTIILEFELPKEAVAFQQYQRAVKQPDGIRELTRFCEKNNIRDPQMKTHEPNQGENNHD